MHVSTIRFILYILLPLHILAQNIPIKDLSPELTDHDLTISPSGKYMASVKRLNHQYAIWITDVKKVRIKYKLPPQYTPPYNINWISENRLSYEQFGMLYAINLDGTEKQQLMSLWKDKDKYRTYKNFQTTKLVNILEDDFEHILVESRGYKNYPILLKLNIYTGEKTEVENGDEYEINQWLLDKKGNAQLGIRHEDDEILFFSRGPNGEWRKANHLNLNIYGSTFLNQKYNFLDFDYNNDIVYIATTLGKEHWYVASFSLEQNAFIDTVLIDDKYDIGSPINDDTELLFSDSEKKLAGIRYQKDKPTTKWFSKNFQAIYDSLKIKYPEFYPEIFDWNKDASIVLVRVYNDVDPGYLLIYDVKNNKSLVFSTLAKKLFNYKLSKTEIVRYKARDGYEIEGYLNLPFKPLEGKPIIVMPHGGPWARDYWGYDPIVQYLTLSGYGVFKMNFRGSSGYGVKHLTSGIKAISEIMVDDIADGAKWLLKNNYTFRKDLFLYDHSYGGYAALMSLVKYPELYNSAISIGAPTDIVELIEYLDDNNRDFAYEFWKAAVGDPDEEEEKLEAISPIHNILKIKKPIFLFHGEKDEIVPVEQAESFVEEAEDLGLKILNKILKNEDHSISENRNTEFILKKAIQFFKKNSVK